ncbi:tetratricopeptide repeat protein, partial [bacterium]|nr:tetratricopeptide repeat protein [bacterium]
ILCNEESFARSRTIRAAIHTMLDKEPIVDTVSWMIPITRALNEGGLSAAWDCYEQLKQSSTGEYYFDPDDLVNLVYQMMSVKNIDLAIDVMTLNIRAFPEHIESYTYLANLYLQRGDPQQARVTLLKALEKEPGNTAVADLLEKA